MASPLREGRYSRMAGTGASSASSGSQIRAARRVPSASGIHVLSIRRTRRGNSVLTPKAAPLDADRATLCERCHASRRARYDCGPGQFPEGPPGAPAATGAPINGLLSDRGPAGGAGAPRAGRSRLWPAGPDRRQAVEGAMATRLTYTSGTRTPELDAAFEACLAAAREDTRDPLPHLVAGGERPDGPELVREGPRRGRRPPRRPGPRRGGPDRRRWGREPRPRGAGRPRRRGGRRGGRGAARV